MACTEELSDFQCGTVIGCHLSNKSVCKISALLELPQSTVSAVIVKWKHLVARTAQPRSGRPHKLTERDRRVLKRIVCKNRLPSVATLTIKFQTASGKNVSTRTVHQELHELGSIAEKPHTSLRSPCSMPSVGWSGVKLAAIGHWSSENAFSGVMNHASRTNPSLADARRTLPAPMHSANCKVWWRRNNDLGLFFMVQAP